MKDWEKPSLLEDVEINTSGGAETLFVKVKNPFEQENTTLKSQVDNLQANLTMAGDEIERLGKEVEKYTKNWLYALDEVVVQGKLKNKAKEGLRALLNKVNRVTCSHRHGQKVTKKDLDSLSYRQIEVEETLKKIGESDE